MILVMQTKIKYSTDWYSARNMIPIKDRERLIATNRYYYIQFYFSRNSIFVGQ